MAGSFAEARPAARCKLSKSDCRLGPSRDKRTTLNLAYVYTRQGNKPPSYSITRMSWNVAATQRLRPFPADSVFGAFGVSYRQGLREMNSAEEFCYTANTVSIPVKTAALQHPGRCGQLTCSRAYTGSGASFLDGLENGIWRLAVMPDVLPVGDPFAKASLSKEVRRVAWTEQSVAINLKDRAAQNSPFRH